MAKAGKTLDYQSISKIRKLKIEGNTIREIVKEVGVSSATVIKYLHTKENQEKKEISYTDIDVLKQMKHDVINSINEAEARINQKLEDLEKKLNHHLNNFSQYPEVNWNDDISKNDNRYIFKTISEIANSCFKQNGKNPSRHNIRDILKKWKNDDEDKPFYESNKETGYPLDEVIKAIELYNLTAKACDKLRIVLNRY